MAGAEDPLVDEPLDVLAGGFFDRLDEIVGVDRLKGILAKEVGDRVIFLDEGRIVEEGSVEQIFSNPEKERTKQFISQIL